VRLVFGRDKEVADWVRQFGFTYEVGFVAIGVENRDGVLVGAHILANYSDHDIELNIFGRAAVCRSAWDAMGDYVFNTLGCSRITIKQKPGERAERKFALRLGFVEEGRMRNYYGDVDAIILGLLKKDFRYGR
jgi:RimJ/RimL family protein N-acetyltransferase